MTGVRASVAALDRLLRRVLGVVDLTDDPECLFRIALRRNRRRIRLRDGTVVERGDRVAELHFANERFPGIGPAGPGIGWATELLRRLRTSFALVARVELDPVPVAYRGDLYLAADHPHTERLLARLGFEVEPAPKGGVAGSIARRWAGVLSWALVPGSGSPFRPLRRHRIWMSRVELVRRYGVSGGGTRPAP